MLAAIFIARSPQASRTLHVDGHQYHLELARSTYEHEKGLSGRQSLGYDRGMLFIFQQESQRCFWMKDMYFAVDIIWTDASRRVIFLQQHASPDSYPRTFCSSDPAAYVLELPAGSIADRGIRKGQILNF